jgi:hypothetical protein
MGFCSDIDALVFLVAWNYHCGTVAKLILAGKAILVVPFVQALVCHDLCQSRQTRMPVR